MTARVVIYARYSSDAQRRESIDDQLRICRERAAREGWQIVGLVGKGHGRRRPGPLAVATPVTDGDYGHDWH